MNLNQILRTESLSIKYHQKHAFRDVTMPIHKGCITALIGPSGCGKTSFLMCLNRLVEMVPYAEVTGNVHLGDKNLFTSKMCGLDLRRRVGMIFQKPNPFPLSIRKNILLPLRETGIKDKALQEETLEVVLTQVGLWAEVKDRLNTSALVLSGGQQQRLCIARALALRPEVLLMDEPCSALDPISSGVVEDLITSLRQKYTVVIVTHNLAQARRIADYTGFFWMKNGAGSLIEFGLTKMIFDEPQDPLTYSYIQGLRG